MINSYNFFLEKINKYYPEIYIKIYRLPSSSIKGIINNFQQSGIKIDNTEKVKIFFDNQPQLREFDEIEFVKK